MITADQILAHAVGDYILQSDWMATQKTRQSAAAFAHALTYTLAFLFLTQRAIPLLVIFGTHFIIDRWRLARFIVWAKNWIAPKESNIAWVYCTATGYPPDRPIWLTTWLLIIADNILHVSCNGLALSYL